MSSALKELVSLTDVKLQPQIRLLAIQQMLSMSTSPDFASQLVKESNFMENLVANFNPNKKDDEKLNNAIFAILINLSAYAPVVADLCHSQHLIESLCECILDYETIENIKYAENSLIVLSNLTVEAENAESIYKKYLCTPAKLSTQKLIAILRSPALTYTSSLISNLTQLKDVRKILLDENETCNIKHILPLILIDSRREDDEATEISGSNVRRAGAVRTVRNCLFEESSHEWIVKGVSDGGCDILNTLLLPLAGPTPDHWTEDEVEKLPIDLQYLESSKRMESDPYMVEMLVECIHQLCTLKSTRQILRDCNVYLIMKQVYETASNEMNKKMILAIENVIDILIKKEGSEMGGVDNLKKDVDIPVDVIPQLEDMDRQYLNNE